MNKGKRVLAIACKAITPNASGDYTRDVESNLSFIGFMVFDCALKPDSKSVINELITANYKLVMITGDSPNTAAEVGNKLGMLNKTKDTYVLDVINGHVTATYQWACLTTSATIPYDFKTIKQLANQYNLCVGGPALQQITKGKDVPSELLYELCKYCNVFGTHLLLLITY